MLFDMEDSNFCTLHISAWLLIVFKILIFYSKKSSSYILNSQNSKFT